MGREGAIMMNDDDDDDDDGAKLVLSPSIHTSILLDPAHRVDQDLL